mgnify:CR=1 FL=1
MKVEPLEAPVLGSDYQSVMESIINKLNEVIKVLNES